MIFFSKVKGIQVEKKKRKKKKKKKGEWDLKFKTPHLSNNNNNNINWKLLYLTRERHTLLAIRKENEQTKWILKKNKLILKRKIYVKGKGKEKKDTPESEGPSSSLWVVGCRS